MELIYNLLGRLLFTRRQDWHQRRSAKTLVLTIAFSVAFGLVMAEVIRFAYNHKR